jgi:hypothetical protein
MTKNCFNLPTTDPVEHVRAKNSVIDQRMIEVVARVVGHPKALHYAARTKVDGRGERDHLPQRQIVDSVDKRGASSFSRIAASPPTSVKSPSDFDRRREVRLEPWFRQADEADEQPRLNHFNCPKTPTLSFDQRVRLTRKVVAFAPAEGSGEVPHHLRVGVQLRKRLEVFRAPLS